MTFGGFAPLILAWLINTAGSITASAFDVMIAAAFSFLGKVGRLSAAWSPLM